VSADIIQFPSDDVFDEPQDTLDYVQGLIEDDKIKPNQLMVLALTTEGDCYDINMFANNIKLTEMVALLEAVKASLVNTLIGRGN